MAASSVLAGAVGGWGAGGRALAAGASQDSPPRLPAVEMRAADLGLSERNGAVENNAALARIEAYLDRGRDRPVRLILGAGTFRFDPIVGGRPLGFRATRSMLTITGEGPDRTILEGQTSWTGENSVRPLMRIGHESRDVTLEGFTLRHARDCLKAPRSAVSMLQVFRVRGLTMRGLRFANASDISAEFFGPQDFLMEDIEIAASRADGLGLKSGWPEPSRESWAPRRGIIRRITCTDVADDNVAIAASYLGGDSGGGDPQRAGEIEISDIDSRNGLVGCTVSLLGVERTTVRNVKTRGFKRAVVQIGRWHIGGYGCRDILIDGIDAVQDETSPSYRDGAGRQLVQGTGVVFVGNGNPWKVDDADRRNNYRRGDPEVAGLTIRNVKAQVHHVPGLMLLTHGSNWERFNADCMRDITIEDTQIVSTQRDAAVPLPAVFVQGVHNLVMRRARFSGFDGPCIQSSRYAMAFEDCVWTDCRRRGQALIELGSAATVGNALSRLDRCRIEVGSGSFARIWNATAPVGEDGRSIDSYVLIGGSAPTDLGIRFAGTLLQEWEDPDGARRRKRGAPRAHEYDGELVAAEPAAERSAALPTARALAALPAEPAVGSAALVTSADCEGGTLALSRIADTRGLKLGLAVRIAGGPPRRIMGLAGDRAVVDGAPFARDQRGVELRVLPS